MLWILESGVFDENIESLKENISDNGDEYYVLKENEASIHVNGLSTDQLDIPKMYSDYGPNIFYGSLGLSRDVYTDTNWGLYCNLKNFQCSHYYPYFGKSLLNVDGFFLPFGWIEHKKEQLFSLFGESFFIRPNDGFKSFTGKIMSRSSWDENIEFCKSYRPDDDLLCFVSSSKNIGAEWRFLVVNGEVVAGSSYKGYADISSAKNYAQSVVDRVKFSPDPAWTLDICESDGILYVLEIGSFSCAGLYDMDLTKVVPAISNCVTKEWEETYGIYEES